ncbi:unnamed protein product, partial [Didymodactylos carnosus]
MFGSGMLNKLQYVTCGAKIIALL